MGICISQEKNLLEALKCFNTLELFLLPWYLLPQFMLNWQSAPVAPEPHFSGESLLADVFLLQWWPQGLTAPWPQLREEEATSQPH